MIDGEREISLACKHGIELESIFVDEAKLSELVSVCGETIIRLIQPVTSKVLERISYGQRQSSPVAIGRTPQTSLADLRISQHPLLLVLDHTEKPGNLGACLRTASACGIDAVILTHPICELHNPNTIRASRGTVFSLPVAVATAQELQDFCRAHDVQLFTARVDATASLWNQDLKSGGAFVFGSEAHGLGTEWNGPGLQSFSIPMRGVTDSLNLSISAAVTLYEALRQRIEASN